MANGHGAITPEALASALAKLDALAAAQVASNAVPGLAIAVVHDDQVVFSQGYGVRNVTTGLPVDADTVFQIASLSKPISSTVVAAVVGTEGASWDSLVADRLPDFVLQDAYVTRNVSLRDCFAHRTGMPGLVGGDLETLGYSREEIIYRLRFVPLAGKFRQTYSYSNMMLTAGAEAAVAPLGQSWEAVAEERIFAPLGMTSTSYRHADFLARENRAALHMNITRAWLPVMEYGPDAQAAAGGASASVADLAQWMRLQLAGGRYSGEQIIEPMALVETHVPQVMRGINPVTGLPTFYALGWNVETNPDGRVVWRHAGAFVVGARTELLLVPDASLGIVCLTAAFPTGTPDAINDSFYDLVFHGAVRHDWFAIHNATYEARGEEFAGDAGQSAPPGPATPALPLAAYTGTYRNDYIGEAVVEADGDILQVTIGPDHQAWPLTHVNRDVFSYPRFPSPQSPIATAIFTIGEDGTAETLLLTTLDTIGQGTLRRSRA